MNYNSKYTTTKKGGLFLPTLQYCIKRLLLLIILCGVGYASIAQDCNEEFSVGIAHEKSLNDFLELYGHCSELPNAFLILEYLGTYDLQKLDRFKSLGRLFIDGRNSQASSLEGFNVLEKVNDLRIFFFPELKTIEGFNKVDSCLFEVAGLPKLEKISGLENSRKLHFYISNCPKLITLEKFNRVDLVELTLLGEISPELILPRHIRKISRLRVLETDDVLIDLFRHVEEIQSVYFKKVGWENLDVLEHVQYNGDSIASEETLEILRSPNLSNCHIPMICDMLDAYGDRSNIFANGMGCNTKEEVLSRCEARKDCRLPNGVVILDSQRDVDSLGMKYRSCDRLYGDVHIIGDWDLRPLDHFRHFGGLRITGMADDRLEGLDSLVSVRWLSIEENPYLEEIVGLKSLEYTSGSLRLYRNPRLRRPSFPSLREVGGLEISVYGGRDLSGLDSLRYIDGGLKIQNCGSLEGLSGLDSLRRITRVLNLHNNRSLEDISILGDKDLSTIDELTITVNPSLSMCHHESICEWLEEVNRFDYVNIQSNADGCMSESEVLMSCGVIDATEDSEEVGLQLYPNPTSGLLHIETEVSYDGVVIYDVRGRQLYRFGELEIIDLRGYLGEGMYWVHLQKDGAIVGSGTFMKVE